MSTTLTTYHYLTANPMPVPTHDRRVNARRPAPEPTAAQRAYLKALRRAELAAWHQNGGRIEISAQPFRYARAELIRQRRRERWLFALSAAVAASAILLAFQDPLQMSQHWADFVAFVQQLFG